MCIHAYVHWDEIKTIQYYYVIKQNNIFDNTVTAIEN